MSSHVNCLDDPKHQLTIAYERWRNELALANQTVNHARAIGDKTTVEEGQTRVRECLSIMSWIEQEATRGGPLTI